MVELNEKALDAACRAYEDATPSGYRYVPEGIAAALRAYLTALPTPDGLEVIAWASPDALRKLAGRSPTVVEPSEFEDATTALTRLSDAQAALQSKDEQIERLTRERDEALADPYKVMGGIYEKWKARAEAAEQQVQKLTAENERLRGVLEAADYLIDRLRNARFGNSVRDMDEAEVAYTTARSAFEAQEGGK